MRAGLGFLLVLASLVAHPALASPRETLPELPKVALADFPLDSGDVVHVAVFGEDKLTGSFTVTPTGQIDMPLLGAIPARGRTPHDVGLAIVEKLEESGELKMWHADVTVERWRPVVLAGDVAHPGSYPYAETLRVRDALALAGGADAGADTAHPIVTRLMAGEPVRYRASERSQVMPGDVITLAPRG